MLSYRHSFHAGNHADVLKHAILVSILDHMNVKEKGWCYFDTHAGAGLYHLDDEHAQKNREYERGCVPVLAAKNVPPMLARYQQLVKVFNKEPNRHCYPGSPLLAAQLMRKQDNLRLFELHPTDYPLLCDALRSYGKSVHTCKEDGLQRLKSCVPPRTHRGLILIDPSYEVKQDYQLVPHALQQARQRFVHGIYVVWYPMLAHTPQEEFMAQMAELAGHDYVHVELQVCDEESMERGMYGSGLWILNPPWMFVAALEETLPALVQLLGQDKQACYHLDYHQA